ncbi:MAG: PDZ domain-containing protein [Candidatus Solibacter sp.]
MISRNWPNAFVRACAIISALCLPLAAQNRVPAIALVDAADALTWQNWTREAGWQVITAAAGPNDIDSRVKALAAAVESAIQSGAADSSRIYLAGRGDASSAVFYAVSRVPDLWAAAAALGGSPRSAVDTNRIFTVNFTQVPVLWIATEDAKPFADKLKAANLNLEFQTASSGANAASVLQWLAAHKRQIPPTSIDCETNAPSFARCYWIQLTKFDAAERNDVLASSRLPAGNGAALDLGGFGYKVDDPGPGVLVSTLPEKYSGPLKAGDRMVALDGKAIADARQFQETLEKVTEEKPAVVTVQRGKDRVRVETRFTLPRRESGVTARVQAEYLPAEHEIQIVTRTITELRVTVPADWLPATLQWNGLTLEKLKEPGCWKLAVQKELLHAEKCQ